MNRVLQIIGMPLQADKPLPETTQAVLDECDIYIGENRKTALRFLKNTSLGNKEVFFMDPIRQDEEDSLFSCLKALPSGSRVALFSDGGMPILFDPGTRVLEECRRLGYEICVEAGPISWATACAACGWSAPFWVEGFLPQKKEERVKRLKQLFPLAGNLVLMDTPYRFKSLLDEVKEAAKGNQRCFLAWEIGSNKSRYQWGTPQELIEYSKKQQMVKGEFILILAGEGKTSPSAYRTKVSSARTGSSNRRFRSNKFKKRQR